MFGLESNLFVLKLILIIMIIKFFLDNSLWFFIIILLILLILLLLISILLDGMWLVLCVELCVKVKIFLILKMKILFFLMLYLILVLLCVFNIWYLLWIGKKYFGLINWSINCWLFWELCFEVWMLEILLWIIFVLVLYKELIVLLIFFVLFGIGDELNIMVFLGIILICLWVLLVILDNVVIGLFCELVYSINNLCFGMVLILLGLINVLGGVLI